MSTERVYYSKDAEMHAVRRVAIRTVLFLAFGLGVGIVLALFFAPTSGKKLRENLIHTVEEGLNTGRETVEPVLKKIEGQMVDLRHTVEDRVKNAAHLN